MRISETETANEQEERVGADGNMLIIRVNVGQHIEGQKMGIGIIATNAMN